MPKYDSFGFSEEEPQPPDSPHTLAVHQRSKELLAFKIGPELLSDSESDTEEELEILALPRELPFTPQLFLQGALQRYMDGLLLLARYIYICIRWMCVRVCVCVSVGGYIYIYIYIYICIYIGTDPGSRIGYLSLLKFLR